MSLPNAKDATELIKQGGETIKQQAEAIQKFPWGWVIAVTVLMFVVSWGINNWYFSGQLDKKDKRIVVLETQVRVGDSIGNARLERATFIWEERGARKDSIIYSLYYKLGINNGAR